MSSLIVRIVELAFSPHTNATTLSLANPVGTDWQVVVKTELFKNVTSALYIPIDSMIPSVLAQEWGLPVKSANPYRLKSVRLRGEISQGLLVPNTWGWEVGFDAAETLGITKWEASLSLANTGGARRNPDGFIIYTDIENIKNFPATLVSDEPIIITEKIHGSSFRAGWIESGSHLEPIDHRGYRFADGIITWVGEGEEPDVEKREVKDYTWCVGSHRMCLKADSENHYTRASQDNNLELKLKNYPGYMVFGEVYGRGIQSMQYGLTSPQLRIFDVWNGAEYLSSERFDSFCRNLQLPTVPILYSGAYSSDVLALRKGKAHSGDHIREGIVIRPIVERYERGLGRVILKSINEDYLLGNYDADEVG